MKLVGFIQLPRDTCRAVDIQSLPEKSCAVLSQAGIKNILARKTLMAYSYTEKKRIRKDFGKLP
ncbi:MAG: hypothetical protein Q8K17_01000, partial [Pseudohongiella sp.]|nr:hypothetical protein [Pseudohongiella sp.]